MTLDKKIRGFSDSIGTTRTAGAAKLALSVGFVAGTISTTLAVMMVPAKPLTIATAISIAATAPLLMAWMTHAEPARQE